MIVGRICQQKRPKLLLSNKRSFVVRTANPCMAPRQNFLVASVDGTLGSPQRAGGQRKNASREA